MAAINQLTTAKGSQDQEEETECVTRRTDGSPLIGLQPPKALCGGKAIVKILILFLTY